jgi:putative tryptophan/tyrosine transport system substrate-binding protein
MLQQRQKVLARAPSTHDPKRTFLRQRAKITAQVLRGTKPADIPVQQPDRFELVINLKAAKAIGVEIPATLVARADKLIDERT